jgi:hypothetical protein
MTDKPFKYYMTFIVKQGYAIDLDITSERELNDDEARIAGIKHILSPERQLHEAAGKVLDYPRNSEDIIACRYRKRGIGGI